MMFIKWWVDGVFLVYEKMKGTRTLHEVLVPQCLHWHLSGLSVSGYEIRLYCQKKLYRRQYHRWFIPSRNYVIYHVSSTTSNDAPASLKDACQLDVSLPAIIPHFVSEELQKEVAIQAYLDLLIRKLETKPAFA